MPITAMCLQLLTKRKFKITLLLFSDANIVKKTIKRDFIRFLWCLKKFPNPEKKLLF